MRIATGVLLILVSLVNGCAGAGIAFVGAVASGGSELLDHAAEDARRKAGGELDPEKEAELAKAQADMDKVSDEIGDTGGLLMLIGFALLVLFGLQIAAAVCLFATKAAKFIMGVGALGLVVGLLFMFAGDANVFIPLISIAVSALAIVAGKGMAAETTTGASAPPPPATA